MLDSGQGGGQAIEDGYALGVLFRNATKGDVAQRLDLFQKARYKRTTAIMIFSNYGQDEAHKIGDQANKYVEGRVPGNIVL